MKRALSAAVLTFALVMPAAAQVPLPQAPSSVPKNPQIDIAYVVPKDAKYRPIYDKLKQARALETLQEFLAPLRLPRKLTIKVDQCGALQAPYKPQGPVTICYEYVLLIEQNAPAGRFVVTRDGVPVLSKDAAIVGAFVHVALYEMAHAVFDQLRIPVWGNVDDAADFVAGLIMLEFGDDVAWVTLIGTSFFFAQRGFMGQGDFSDVVRSGEAQRYYNFLCIAYGADPRGFGFLVRNANLPENRGNRCIADYRKLRLSFRQSIMPHLDLELLQRVQGQDWYEKLGFKPNPN